MFEPMHRDRTLRYLRFEITGAPLALLIAVGAELPGQHDPAVGPPIRRDDALRLADMPEFDQHRVRVVDRHDPAAHHRAAERVLFLTGLPDRRDLL